MVMASVCCSWLQSYAQWLLLQFCIIKHSMKLLLNVRTFSLSPVLYSPRNHFKWNCFLGSCIWCVPSSFLTPAFVCSLTCILVQLVPTVINNECVVTKPIKLTLKWMPRWFVCGYITSKPHVCMDAQHTSCLLVKECQASVFTPGQWIPPSIYMGRNVTFSWRFTINRCYYDFPDIPNATTTAAVDNKA